MRIVLASSEAVPFSKTGGLADVAAALSKALARDGHDVWLLTPFYPQARQKQGAADLPFEPTDWSIEVAVGSKLVTGNILRSRLPRTNVTVLLIDQPDYFDRHSLYQKNNEDYRDNCERFVFFSRAVMETVRLLELQPDVIHANDWQTGLIPALLDIEYRYVPGFEQTSSVFTIHNMAFQGRFWKWDMELTGLDWKYFNWKQMEYFDDLNLLKAGLVFADLITTVSPTYAREIQTEPFGCGLHGVLRARRGVLVGILNGVDTEIWNPTTDPALAQNYSCANGDASSKFSGKAVCKAHLQKQQRLSVRSDVPLVGMISRMTDQKGFDLIAKCADELLQLDLQLIFLGTGQDRYERFLEQLSQKYASKVSVTIGFDDKLAHQIEAGTDAYLMPSQFEPCGLNQMYSLIYGTVPIVRRVGGLADSVVDATDENLADGTATGFCFDRYDPGALVGQVRRAVEIYADRPKWSQLVCTGMWQEWSWTRSAAEYVKVYRRVGLKRDRSTPACSSPG